MQARRAVVGAMILALLTVVAGGVLAADAKSFTLMGQKDSPKASGTAALEGNTLTIIAKGLKPNAVYTVWFVNMQPSMSKAGAGTPPYGFKTDAKGNAKYAAGLTESPVGKWQVIFIMRHPSGDPTDMAQMEDALMTQLM